MPHLPIALVWQCDPGFVQGLGVLASIAALTIPGFVFRPAYHLGEAKSPATWVRLPLDWGRILKLAETQNDHLLTLGVRQKLFLMDLIITRS